jgi:hypothetical protein
LVLILILLILSPLSPFFISSPPPLASEGGEGRINDGKDSDSALKASDFAHHFRANRHAGVILVVTGRLSLGKKEPQGSPKAKVRLLDPEGKVISEREAFAGNILSEEELSELTMEEILSFLGRERKERGEIDSPSPKKDYLPVMLVFDSLPMDFAEYAVELSSGAPD